MTGNYRKSILDQGGAIVMIPTSAAHPDITHILYVLLQPQFNSLAVTDYR